MLKSPINVYMTFSKTLLTRAIKDILRKSELFCLHEVDLDTINCRDVNEIDVILCETEILTAFEKQHICLAPKTLGISVWNNMISISKGDLQSYNDLDEIVQTIKTIANKDIPMVKCDNCMQNLERGKNMFLHGTSKINDKGHLEIGGCDAVELSKEFGTPLYVFDEKLIRDQIKNYHKAFQSSEVKYQVAYASKAFSCLAMYKLAEQENMSLEVVSAGELHTAVKADFPRERIHFHGNNKTEQEINYGLDENIGCFVVDNACELQLLNDLAAKKNKTAKVLMRITPGVEAHTHEYIQTGQADSKFGFDLQNGQAHSGVEKIIGLSNLQLIGFHAHIGSQIFEVNGFEMAATKMVEWYAKVINDFKLNLSVLNLGGGFGIRYNSEDTPLSIEEYITAVCNAIKEEAKKHGINLPEIWVEPGRSIVGEAGTTLYTVGTSKDIPGIRKYVAVDGGMTDNLRPAMYKAKYEAMIANKANITAAEKVSVAGKCCESGDMLIWDVMLADPKPGDIMAVSCTGAYGYAMANNYNRIPRAAAVFVKDGDADLIIRRESLDDIIMNDIVPDRFK